MRCQKRKVKSEKRTFLILSLTSNFVLLFFFKYFNFFNDSTRNIFQSVNIFYDVPAFHILLPVGISFYTFQAASYLIDVYWGRTESQKHFGIFALYITFFPQLVAGPIERSSNLLPQFFEKHKFSAQQASDGLKLMLWGFFKKIVIADRLALYVNQVYNNPAEYNGLTLILATYFFAVQIYCDFSGYSDIAIGAAQVMGYRLMTNFNLPYMSKSIVEFWRRWHISLSTWLRDYIFFPLSYSGLSKWRYAYNTIVVFFLCGLWHGANWTFVIWGILHGFFIVFSNLTDKMRNRLWQMFGFAKNSKVKNAIKVFITFHLIWFSWIFFRSNSLSDAFLIITNMLNINLSQLEGLDLSLGWYEILLAIAAIAFMEFVQVIQKKRDIITALSHQKIWLRWSIYYLVLFSIILFGQFKETEFIYFQF